MTEPLPELVTRVTADVDDAVSGLAEVVAAEKAVGDQSDKTTTKVKKNQKDQGSAVSDFNRLFQAAMKDGESASTSFGRAVDQQRIKIKSMQDQFNRPGGASTSLFGDLKGAEKDLKSLLNIGETLGSDFAKEGAQAGENFVQKFGASVTDMLPGAISNPYIGAALVGVAVVAAPGIAAVIGGAVASGFGLGVIGIGALSLKNDPAVVSALSGLKADVASVFSSSAGGLSGPLSGGLDELDKTIKEISPDLTHMFDAAAGPATALFNGISGFVHDAAPIFAKAMEDAAPAVDALAADLPAFGTALAQTIDLMASGAGDAQGLNDIFSVLDFTLLAVGESVNWLSNAYEFMRNPGSEIAHLMGDDLQPKMTGVKDTADEMTRAILTGGSGFANFVTDVDATTAALNAEISAMQTWEQVAQSNDDSLLAMKEAQTNFSKELKTGSKNWDENTAAGQKQVANLNSLNEKITGYYNGLAKGAPLTEKQTAAELKATEALLAQAKAAGATTAETATLTGEVSRLKDQLALIKSKKVEITAEIKYNERFTATYVNGAVRPGSRDIASAKANSGVANQPPSYAASGVMTGGQPLAFFAEQSTGREAFVAENGDSNNAKSALREAAGWHDMDMVQRGARGGNGSSAEQYLTVVLTLDSKVVAKELIGPVNRLNSRSGISIYGSPQS